MEGRSGGWGWPPQAQLVHSDDTGGGVGGFEDPLASPETAGAANGQILPPSAPPPPLWVTGSRCSDPPVIQKGKLRLREVRRASLGDKGRQERLLCDV